MGSSLSITTGVRSTGNFNASELIRLTEPRPKTWLGAVPKIVRLTTAIVLLKGSLTNNCSIVPVGVPDGMYGFIRTPSRGSTFLLGDRYLPPRVRAALDRPTTGDDTDAQSPR